MHRPGISEVSESHRSAENVAGGGPSTTAHARSDPRWAGNPSAINADVNCQSAGTSGVIVRAGLSARRQVRWYHGIPGSQRIWHYLPATFRHTPLLLSSAMPWTSQPNPLLSALV